MNQLIRIDGVTIDPAETLIQLDRADCEESLAAFVRLAWHIVEPGQPYVHGWHIDALCAHLEAVTAGEEIEGTKLNRLLINIPPGTMKSLLVGVFWPAWEWGPQRMPHLRYLCASHSQNLAIRDNVRMRRLVVSEWYQACWPHVVLAKDQNAKLKFENTALGFREAVAAGTITGSRGDRVICLPYEAMILSDKGWLPIGEIVEAQLDVKIAGAGNDGIEWQRIEKYERNPARPIVRIECDDAALECTDDHRIFVRDRGWIAAADIIPGDCVVLAPHAQLRQLRETNPGKEKGDEVLRAPVLSRNAEEDSGNLQHIALRDMPEAGVSTASASQAQQQNILFPAVRHHSEGRRSQSNVDGRENRSYLSTLWQRLSAKEIRGKACDVVFSHLCNAKRLGQAWRTAFSQTMHGMRQAFSASQPIRQNVLTGMFCDSSLQKDERKRQWPVYSWRGREALPARMDEDIQSANKKTRRHEVHAVRSCAFFNGANPACSSYQLRQEQSFPDQFDNALQVVSREVAWQYGKQTGLGETIVRNVERTERVVEHTYNVRVAPHHNYFANGILVHNCDDPHSVESAGSDQQRQTTAEWFLEAVPTRLNSPKNSAIIVIMQRLHEEDISGLILDKSLPYTHLMLPMEYEADRACSTPVEWWPEWEDEPVPFADPRSVDGELLFPERFPPEVVERDKAVMGPYAVAGQLQQRPEPRGGGIIKREWWQLWEHDAYPAMDFVVASLDTAYTTKSDGDYSALTVWGVFSGDVVARSVKTESGVERAYTQQHPRVMLMTAWAERLELHELVKKAADTCRAMKVDRLLIENKAAGISVAQEIRRLFGHEDWAVMLVDPKSQDKLARLYSIQHLFAEGMVFAPDRAWADKVITQVGAFPRGKHDDLVDTVSQALRHMRELGMLTRGEEWTAQVQESMRHVGKEPAPLYGAP